MTRRKRQSRNALKDPWDYLSEGEKNMFALCGANIGFPTEHFDTPGEAVAFYEEHRERIDTEQTDNSFSKLAISTLRTADKSGQWFTRKESKQ